MARKTAALALCALAVSLMAAPAMAASDGFWIAGPASGPSNSSGATYPKGPREVTVGATGAQFKTISDGVKAVGAGGVVRVRSGLYLEALKITKPVTIVGDANPSSAKDAMKRPDLLVKVQVPAGLDLPCADVNLLGGGRVTLMQLALVSGDQSVQHSCVELQSGQLVIRDSSITAHNQYVAALLARGGDLSVETTNITGGREGILITSREQSGSYYIGNNNFIFGNITGVKVDGLALANIFGNKIFQNTNGGVVYLQGRGSVIGNEIYNNVGAGIVMQNSPQSPTVRSNTIRDNAGTGIQIVPAVAFTGPGMPLPESKGLICDNAIFNNFGAGIDASAGGLTASCSNELHGNRGDKRPRRGLFGN